MTWALRGNMGSKRKKDSVRTGPQISTPLSRDKLSNLLEGMIFIRCFEERAKGLFQEGKLKGTAHPCIGQEAIAVGSCAALDPKDYIVSNHRGHGHCLARGASIAHMMAELLGRDGGYCRGLGGSMHIAALELNILGANGIVGAGMGLGTGAACRPSTPRAWRPGSPMSQGLLLSPLQRPTMQRGSWHPQSATIILSFS